MKKSIFRKRLFFILYKIISFGSSSLFPTDPVQQALLNLLSIFHCSAGHQEHINTHAANQSIPDDAITIRQLMKQEKAQNRRENDLRIIINRNIPGRRIGICRGNGKLAASSGDPRQKQKKKLMPKSSADRKTADTVMLPSRKKPKKTARSAGLFPRFLPSYPACGPWYKQSPPPIHQPGR